MSFDLSCDTIRLLKNLGPPQFPDYNVFDKDPQFILELNGNL